MSAPPWLLLPRVPRGARVTLYCFTCADGDAGMFQRLRQALDRTADVHDVQCSMHPDGSCGEDRLPPVDVLVRRLAIPMGSAQAMPAIFFGYRHGALVALTLVHQLRELGARGPVKLILSACHAPRYRDLAGDAAFPGGPACGGRHPLAIPITVLAGSQDGAQTPQQIGAWSEETTGLCRVHWFDGDRLDGCADTASILAHIEAELQEAAAACCSGSRGAGAAAGSQADRI